MRSHLNLRLICVYGACIHKIINKQIIVSFTRWEKERNATTHNTSTQRGKDCGEKACPLMLSVTLKLAGVKLLLATKGSIRVFKIHTAKKEIAQKNCTVHTQKPAFRNREKRARERARLLAL